MQTDDRQTIVITGASSGIGAAGARLLSSQGARVVVVGRSPAATQQVAAALGADYYLADFAQLDEVRALAARLLAAYPTIDVLINNAGGIFSARIMTADGHETTFQVNYLAPFLLTVLLQERLSASHARIINTSSAFNRLGRVRLDDLENQRFSGSRAYGTAKLMNILHAVELQRRYGGQIAAVAFHPGVVATGFARQGNRLWRALYESPIGKQFLISPQQGARTMVWLATTPPGTAWQPGAYYDHPGHIGATNAQVHDAHLARAFWDKSQQLIAEGAGADSPR